MGMKKRAILVLGLAAFLLMTACGKGSDDKGVNAGKGAGVSEVLQAGMDAADGKQDAGGDASSNAVASESGENEELAMSSTVGVDMDLTAVSATMAYSQAYNIVNYPENYIGKTLKIKGEFMCYYDDGFERYYYTCMVSDAAGCCTQGFEFFPADGYSYPNDYPEEGQQFSIVGVFDTYEEGGCIYYALKDVKFVS